MSKDSGQDFAYCKRIDGIAKVRVMAESKGWVMVRRKGAVPFVVHSDELRSSPQSFEPPVQPSQPRPIPSGWSREIPPMPYFDTEEALNLWEEWEAFEPTQVDDE